METVILSPRSNPKQAVANNWVVDHMNASLDAMHKKVKATEDRIKEVHAMKLPCELVSKPLTIEIEHPVVEVKEVRVEVEKPVFEAKEVKVEVEKPVFEVHPFVTAIEMPSFNIVEQIVTIEKPVYVTKDLKIDVDVLVKSIKLDRLLLIGCIGLELIQLIAHFWM